MTQSEADQPLSEPVRESPAAISRVFQQLDTTARLPYPRIYYAKRAVWAILWRTLFRLPRAFALRRILLRAMGATVADTSIIYGSVRIYHPWLVEIGEHTTLARDVEIYNLGAV